MNGFAGMDPEKEELVANAALTNFSRHMVYVDQRFTWNGILESKL